MDCEEFSSQPKLQYDEGRVGKVQALLSSFEKKIKERKRYVLMKSSHKEVFGSILSDLISIESQLRKEKLCLLSHLTVRDETIETQRQEIERLRRDNRRLVKRLLKITEVKVVEDLDLSSVEDERDKDIHDCSSKSITQQTNKSDLMISSNFKLNEIQHVSINKCMEATENSKIMHKPPIPEKPKFGNKKLVPLGQSNVALSSQSSEDSSKCNIVSTINLLLGDESDAGGVAESENSSPESTLKSTTPRVIRLARQFENGIQADNGLTGKAQRGERRSSGKALLMEEQEVTSGYNSDSVSDLDHDYENILFVSGKTEGHCELNDSFSAFNSQVKCAPDRQLISRMDFSGIRNGNMKASGDGAYELECVEEAGLMDNFEEFTFDSLDLEDLEPLDPSNGSQSPPESHLRLEGDGAEDKARATIYDPSPVRGASCPSVEGYEKFLEATGLSQKSIVTPFRMFSNHRSMLKPRDIKHRNKLRSAIASSSISEEFSSKHSHGFTSSERREEAPYV